MHFVCRTCSAVQSVVPESESSCVRCGARLLSREATISEHSWYTHAKGAQRGPFSAGELARMFDRGELTWTDEIWRSGLRDWRPARKDDVLVVEVAGARGLDAATTRVDSFTRLLSQGDRDDTLVDVIPAGLASSWPSPPAVEAVPSRTWQLARALRLTTLALLAFMAGGLIVSSVGKLSQLAEPTTFAKASVAPVVFAPPGSGELITRSLPALDEVRGELRRLAPSVERCLRDPKEGLDVDLIIVGKTGGPSQVDLRTTRLTPGMVECAKSAVEALRVAPFTAEQFQYSHHYAF